MTAYKNDNAHVAKAVSLFVHFCNAADCKEMGFVRLQNDIWTAVVLSRSQAGRRGRTGWQKEIGVCPT